MSKYREEKVAIFKHRHCGVCGAPISMDKEFCGPKCEDQFKRSQRKRTYIMIAMMAVFPIILFLSLMMRPR